MAQERRVNEYGDGVAWFRGSMLGKGAFGTVYLATLKNPKSKYSYYPSLMAVKSAEISASGSIQKEREVLSNIEGCPDIIRCFGDETTIGENGAMVYNLLLEYGSGGTLADKIKKLNRLPEIEVRLYARSILRGLNHIHGLGYVHCDLKPDNILLVPGKGVNSKFKAKIGDFGLAKRVKQGKKRKLEPYWRGTPLYLSPEAVIDSVQEAPSDIWALGCIVLEMLIGKPPWERNKDSNHDEILRKIGSGGKLPNVPNEVSKEAREFLKCCFVRKPMFRFTAEMLLCHSFLEGLSDDDDDEVEEIEDVEDSSEVELSEEWSFASEEDSFPYLSEEDEVDEEGTLNDEGIESITELGQSNATQISSPVSPKSSRADFAVSFIIHAGV